MRKFILVLKITFIQIGLCLFLFSAQAKATASYSNTISGTVTDETDQPLVGVSVLEKGTTNGAVTDQDGKFTLSVESEKSILTFSFIGYTQQEVTVGNLTSFKVKMQPDISTLSEVVVIGYGTSKKSDILTSIASVKPENLTKNATLDIGEMLRGKAAGVYVTTNNAGPGGSSRIQIRGERSVSGDATPLIIADGVTIGSINDINPADIESMDILKDAASQAIYGARAANGVIIITTKRGKAGQVAVNYNGYVGTQEAKRNFDVYSGPEFAQLKREAFRATNNNLYPTDASIFSANELDAIAQNRNINWSSEVLKPAVIQNHNVSFNAGTEKTKAYFGTNYQNMTGIVPTTYIKKATVRFNLDQELKKWLKVGLTTSLQWSVTSGPDVSTVVREIVTASPLGNIYNDDGTYNVRPGGNQESFNPLLNLHSIKNTQNNRNDILNVYLELNPIKGLTNRINLGRRSWNYKGLNYNSKLSEAGVVNGFASGSVNFKDNAQWTAENITTYKTNIDNHNLTFTLVESAIETNYSEFNNATNQIPNDLLGIYGLSLGAAQNPTITGTRHRLLSGAARAEYDYLTKYSLAVSGRVDGSSVFGANNKWANFGSVAGGWTISKENFFANITPVNFLKLKASYGSVGYEAISEYGSLALSSPYSYMVTTGGTNYKLPGYAPGNTLSNPNLKWETSTSLNVGMNYELFNSRIIGSVEYYDKRTTNMLATATLATPGYLFQKQNIGEVQNKGIELNLEGILVRNQDLTVRTSATFTRNRNKILHLYGDTNGDGKEEDDAGNNWFIGQPSQVYKQPKYIGVWQGTEVYPGSTFNETTGKWEINGTQAPLATDEKTGLPIVDPYTQKAPVPGTVKIQDKNGDGKIDNSDNYITSKFPKWMGSFNLSANYKGFDFSMDIYTVQGITRQNQFLYDYTAGGDLRGNRNGIKVDYWTPENPTNAYPQPNAGTSPPGMYALGLQDASFVRLQNLTIGYRLPAAILSKIKFSNARVYVTGQNLYTMTKYKGYSPEQDLYSYPMTRNLIFGLSFGL